MQPSTPSDDTETLDPSVASVPAHEISETPSWLRRAVASVGQSERTPLSDRPTPNSMFRMMVHMQSEMERMQKHTQAQMELMRQRTQVMEALAGVAMDGPAAASAILITAEFRRYRALKALRRARTSATFVQSAFRGLCERRMLRRHKEAAVMLEASARRQLCMHRGSA